MYLHVLALANTIEATNTLFQQVGIARQIKQNQVMGELKVASFAADF